MTEESVAAAWLDALRDCWHLARGERLGELRGGRRARLLDDRGMHPYSLAWGRVYACENMLPELQSARLSDPPCDPVAMRRLAHQVAQDDFYDELRTTGPQVFD